VNREYTLLLEYSNRSDTPLLMFLRRCWCSKDGDYNNRTVHQQLESIERRTKKSMKKNLLFCTVLNQVVGVLNLTGEYFI